MRVLPRSGVLRLCAVAAGVSSLVGANDALAQRNLNRPCEAPTTVLISFPKGPDKETAASARERVYSTFNDFKGGAFCLVKLDDIDNMLTLSSFKVDSAYPPLDIVTLAQQLRADEVLDFTVKPVGRTWELSGRVLATRDRQGMLRDSIPKHAPGESPSIAIKAFLNEFKRVHSMLDEVRKCDDLGREGKLAEAEQYARKALKSIPTSNIARLCLASVLREGKKSPEEIFKLTDEVLASDPRNELALSLALNTALDQGDQKKYAEIGGQIIRYSPASPLAESIITQLAAWRMTDQVLPLLSQALKEDPENLTLRRIEFRLILASDNLKLAQERGEDLAKVDTAVVDTAFVNRMVNAYARDSNPQKAAEWLARGTQKWPDNMSFAMGLAQTFKQLGQTQQAIDEYKRVIQVNPTGAKGVRLYIADAYDKSGQPDSAYAWVRMAADAGDDKATAAGVVTAMGIKKLNAAQQSKTIEDWKSAISVLAYADSLNPEDKTAGFYWGVAAFSTAYTTYQAMTENGAKPTCEGLNEVNDYLLLSNEKVRAGANVNQQVAASVLTNFGTMLSAVDQAKTQLKCTS